MHQAVLKFGVRESRMFNQDYGAYSGASQHRDEEGSRADSSQADAVLANILPTIGSLINQEVQSTLAPNPLSWVMSIYA